MSRLFSAVILLSFAGPVSAYAKDKPKELREAIECFPAEDIIKFFSKFDKLKPEQRDTVDVVLTASFDITDDRGLPQRIFTRLDDTDTSFVLLDDGSVPDFGTISQQSKDSELCVEDQAREGLPRDEDGIEFDVDFDVLYKVATGTHDLAALQDGAKDGKSFYKKMMPGPAKLLVPKMTHVSLTYEDEAIEPDVKAWNNNGLINGLTYEPFGSTYVISLDELEDLGANKLVIGGGAYKLEPSPSVKKMKSLGFTEEDEEKEN